MRFFITPSLSKLHNIISVLCNRQPTTEWPSVIFPEESSRFSSRFVSLSGNEGVDREGRVSNIYIYIYISSLFFAFSTLHWLSLSIYAAGLLGLVFFLFLLIDFAKGKGMGKHIQKTCESIYNGSSNIPRL